ncbi:hypothetical protein BH10PSE6_BH10PSE6_29970 [soil metagenome]
MFATIFHAVGLGGVHHKGGGGGGGGGGGRGGGSRPAGCIGAGSEVLTSAGYRPIELLRRGDSVIGYNASDGGLSESKIRRLISRSHQVVFEIRTVNSSFTATRGHPLLTSQGWVRAGKLQVGDMLVRATGAAGAEILSVEKLVERSRVYNLRSRGHTFILKGEFVTHEFCFLRYLRSLLADALHGDLRWSGFRRPQPNDRAKHAYAAPSGRN